MSRRKVGVLLAVAGLLGALWVGQALSAQEGTPERPRGERGGMRGRRFDPERMRERMLDRIKEVLDPTDEEWKVLQPRVGKVQTLSWQARVRGMRMFFGRRGRRPEGAEPTREMSAVEKTVQELGTVLENEQAKPEEIKRKLTALREAREKAKQELAAAQKELREISSVRQEAQLVLMGLLD